MRRQVAATAVAIVAAALLVAGCGSSSAGSGGLVVSAASSLKTALTQYSATFKQANVRLSFAGSDELAAQIRAGARVDVFASANAELPDTLFRAGQVQKPVPFTANRLVLATPAGSTAVKSVYDLVKPGTKVAIGSAAVPVGAYTRQVLRHLPAATARRILANVKSQEPDVAGIVGKLTQGAVDAGFVYASDVAATKGAIQAIPLPKWMQPTVVYEAAVVKNAPHPRQARAFVDGLVRGAGQRALRQAGFLPLP